MITKSLKQQKMFKAKIRKPQKKPVNPIKRLIVANKTILEINILD